MSPYPAARLTALPGVRRWLDRVRTDLRAGRSCLWLLPRSATGGPDCAADLLLEDLLHDVPDFILLPAGDRGPASSVPVSAAPPPRWSGTAPAIDYDDGLSLLDVSSGPGPGPGPGRGPAQGPGPGTRQQAPGAPATASEALAELLERLGKELPAHRGSAAGAGPGARPDAAPGAGRAGGPDGARPDEGRRNEERPNAARPRQPPYATHPALERLIGRGGVPETRPVVVRAWREATPMASAHLLRQLVGAAREAGLPPADRPRALVTAVAEDLPPGLPEQLAREDIAVHWWWGAGGRLDTATVVALSRPFVDGSADRHLLEAVAQATITEICGPFLDVAAGLSEAWDGLPETLPGELRAVVAAAAPPPDTRPHPWDPGRRPGRRPDGELLGAWSAAVVDSWDGRLRRHPAHDLLDDHFVATGVWLAQNHALLPLLDGARERFTGTVRLRSRVPLAELAARYGPRAEGHVTDAAADGVPGDALRAMELGAMWGAHVCGDIALTRTEGERLRLLWTARNQLAHRRPLDGTALRRLATELCR